MKKMLFLVFLSLIVLGVYNINEQNIFIPNSSVRLRVIPNSNSPEDIYIKEQVKKYLENNIYKVTKDSRDIEEARATITAKIPEIKAAIDNIFYLNEYSLKYDVNYGNNYFPQKEYKGMIYDEGYYESLVISIGDAEGDNWWCVMFPNFCLTDIKTKSEYKSYFKERLTKHSKKK